jgi:hypothetical protein
MKDDYKNAQIELPTSDTDLEVSERRSGFFGQV